MRIWVRLTHKIQGCGPIIWPLPHLSGRFYYSINRPNREKRCLRLYKLTIRVYFIGVLRVITRPEFDPTRSKETNYPTRTRPENFGKAFDPTRPVPGFLRAYPTRTDPKFKLKQNFLKIALLLRKIEGFKH